MLPFGTERYKVVTTPRSRNGLFQDTRSTFPSDITVIVIRMPSLKAWDLRKLTTEFFDGVIEYTELYPIEKITISCRLFSVCQPCGKTVFAQKNRRHVFLSFNSLCCHVINTLWRFYSRYKVVYGVQMNEIIVVFARVAWYDFGAVDEFWHQNP